jgi:uncharacterized protein (TIGR03083 family)
MAGSQLSDVDPWALVRDERVDVLALLQGLEPQQWDAASLCAGWRVRDVAAHLLIDDAIEEIGRTRFVAKMARNRFSVDRVNAWWVQRNASVPTSSIVDRFERSLEPGWLSRRAGPANQLRASVIHHQDMRRPLRLERAIPPERLTTVLDAVLTKTGSAGIGAVKRAGGLRLRATDVDWSHGDGPEVTGPGESILMSLAGRADALEDLRGAGLNELATRVTAWPSHSI